MKHAKELFSLDGKIAIVTGGRGLYGGSISTGLCEIKFNTKPYFLPSFAIRSNMLYPIKFRSLSF